MYRSCIFCSGKLGSNDAIEAFQVGRTVAFDGAKGRLWAVCPTCGRWNLAPIEERWEAVVTAERSFRDSRVRVHAENVGLTKLRDGTRLVRVGSAVPRELAAWRFGDEMRRRWMRHRLRLGLARASERAPSILFWAGSLLGPAAMVAGSLGALLLDHAAQKLVISAAATRVVHHSGGVSIRGRDFVGAYLSREGPEPVLNLPCLDGLIVLRGSTVREVLMRAIVGFNAAGAASADVDGALQLLASAPSADGFLDSLIDRRTTFWDGITVWGALVERDPRYWIRRAERLGVPRGDFFRWQVHARDSILSSGHETGRRTLLALEMALHEEQERRALEGELAELEAAWRQAEEIAEIADRLPHIPPPEPPTLEAR
jgi:hypothetical protein